MRQGSSVEIQTPVGIAGIRDTNWLVRLVALATESFNLIFGLVDGSGFFLPDEPRAEEVALRGGQQIGGKLAQGAISVSGLQNLPSGVTRDIMAIIDATNELIDDYFDLEGVSSIYQYAGTFGTDRDAGMIPSPTEGAPPSTESGS